MVQIQHLFHKKANSSLHMFQKRLFLRQIPLHLKAETSKSLNLTRNSKNLCANNIMSISSGWMFSI